MSQSKKAKAANNNKRNSHVFRGIRDPVVVDAFSSTPTVSAVASDASGNGTATYVFSSYGTTGLTAFSSTSTGIITWTSVSLDKPYLSWLMNQAKGFKEYRISNAKLVFVGNVGSTATGRIAILSSPNSADIYTPLTLGNVIGGSVFDLASLASREKSIPLNIDSSWKRVSDKTMLQFAGTPATISPSATVDDLSFCSVRVQLIAATQAGTLGVFTAANMFVVYDAEFRGPISPSLNA
jgi:hypothetical protein